MEHQHHHTHDKHTCRDDETRQLLINRLNRMEGQMRGIASMVEQDAYCDDILIQIAAIKSGLDSFAASLFEDHMRTCVVRDIKANDPNILHEVLTTVKRLTR